MWKNLISNYKSIKNGARSAVFVCYILALLPLLTAIICGLFSLFTNNLPAFATLYSQYFYLLILFPLLLIAIDVTMVIAGKRRWRFSIKDFCKNYYEIIFIALFVLLLLISSLVQFAQNVYPNGFVADVKNPFNIGLGIPIMLLIGMSFLFGFGLKNRTIAENIIVCITMCSTILCILTLIDPKGNFIIHLPNNTNWSGMFNNSNYYGFYLTITTTILAGNFSLNPSKLIKWYSFCAMLLHFVVIFLNNSFACMLSVIIALIVLLILCQIYKRRFSFLATLPIICFVGISVVVSLFASKYYSNYIGFFYELQGLMSDIKDIFLNPTSASADLSGTGRFGLWRTSIKSILSHPLFGNGNTYTNPHSEYLQLAEIWGLPCLTMYLVSVIIVFVKFFRNFKGASYLTIILAVTCIGYLTSSLFGGIMPHIAPLFVMILGMFYRFCNVDRMKLKLQKSIKTEGIIITDQNVLN